MYKKIFVIFLVAVFLISSVSFISASDNDSDSLKDIDVKKVWNDNGFESQRPSYVQIQLVVDGKVVDTLNLNATNNWSGTFKSVDVSGDVNVKEVGESSDYSISYKGSVNGGFVITSDIIETSNILGNSDEDNAVAETNDSAEETDELGVTDEINSTDESNGTDEDNSTSQEDDNSTDESNGTDEDNSTSQEDNNSTGDDSTANITLTGDSKKDVKVINNKEIKKDHHPPKKPEDKKNNTVDLKNTGLPIALVIVAMAAIFVPFTRRKD